jgi:hypothetical protein
LTIRSRWATGLSKDLSAASDPPVCNRSPVVLSNPGQLFDQLAEDLLLTASFSEHTFAYEVGQGQAGVAGAAHKQALLFSAELHAD